jgi:hypothetical protein
MITPPSIFPARKTRAPSAEEFYLSVRRAQRENRESRARLLEFLK